MSGNGHRLNKNHTIPAEYNQPTNHTTRLKCAGAYRKERTLPHLDNRVIVYRLVNTFARRSAGAGDFWRKAKKMDLIDRQALLKQIEIDSDGEPGYYGDTWKFIDTIKNLPSAQPKWMKAKWKPVEVDSDYNVWLWECENCHEETEFKWDFCPVCGCEMTNATKVNG